MTVLIIGGTGYIGSQTAIELIQSGEDVIIADHLSNSEIDVIYKIREITDILPEFFN